MKIQVIVLSCVFSGTIYAKDGLEKKEVQKIIRENLKQVRSCYEQVLEQNKQVQGKIKVNFSINPSGNVSKVGIAEDTVQNSTLSECLSKKIMQWKFPEPRGGKEVKITYPFTFKPF